jgi:hypothetical protein
VAKAAVKMGRAAKTLERWCSANKWVERAKAWDAYVDKRDIENRLATVDTVSRMVVNDLSLQIKIINEIVDAHVGGLQQRVEAGDMPSVRELRDMIALIREKSALVNSVSNGAAYGIRDDVYEL